MNLQEVAFMVSLINANYRRRMLYFWGNVVILVISIMMIYYNLFIVEHIPTTEVNAVLHAMLRPALQRILFWSLVLAAAFFRVFIVYALKSDDDENGSSFPWSIKKDQMTSLRQHAEAKGDFEDLRCHVPLHEYFEMY